MGIFATRFFTMYFLCISDEVGSSVGGGEDDRESGDDQEWVSDASDVAMEKCRNRRGSVGLTRQLGLKRDGATKRFSKRPNFSV